MKKILCFIITVTLLLTSTSVAFAKSDKSEKHDRNKITHQHNNRIKEKKQSFKFKESPVIKYDRYKLPISPVTKGMGATVTFDKKTAVLTVEKGNITIVIDFKNETVKVNGVLDTDTGIFSARSNNKMTVLIKYIAEILGIRSSIDKDKVIIEVPGLDYPTNVTVIPVGTTVLPNTLNSTTLYMTASANIKAGQATGGKAELYVGNKRIATDAEITATDTQVTFTTTDGTPVNTELQSAVPTGGVVTVRLYNANNDYVISKVANPTLVVDYIAPTITAITSATYQASGSKLNLAVTGAGAVGDKVDVTRITLYDTTLGRSYQLTDATGTGSNGVVKSNNLIQVDLGSVDKLGLAGFGTTTMALNIVAGPFLKDAAGNTSLNFTQAQYLPVTVLSGLDVPTNVTVTPVGTTVLPNTLNTTTLYMTVTANITAGQATGGKAELYVGNKLVSIDANINATDTLVTFTTSDNTPTNSELQAYVPTGGAVVVKLYNASNHSVSSTVNPTLIVDYVAPTIASITSVIYNVPGNQLYLTVTGAGAVGDKVNVTKLSLQDATLGRTYQLTNASGTGSNGIVSSSSTLVINLGSLDKLNLAGFGSSTILNVAPGSLLTDAAGNTSAEFTSTLTFPVTIIKY